MSKGIEIAAWCYVTRDGEQKTSAAGNSYGVVTLSADSGSTDDAGKPVPAFMRVLAFGNLASVAANLRKGGKANWSQRGSAKIARRATDRETTRRRSSSEKIQHPSTIRWISDFP